MPTPGNKLSTDYFLYENIYSPLSAKLCFIDPNHITVACFLMLAPILWGLTHKWSLLTIATLMFVRQSLDCLDGAVARTCNRKSKAGALLDLVEDTLTVAILGIFTVYTLWSKRNVPKWIPAVAAAALVYTLWCYIQHLKESIDDKPVQLSPVEHFLHDNTVVLSVIAIGVIYWLVHSI